MENYWRLLRLVRPYWPRLALALASMIAGAVLQAGVAFMVKPILDQVFYHRNANTLFLLAAAVIVLYAAKAAFGYLDTYLMSWIGQRAVANLRNALFVHIQRLSLSFFNRTPTGEINSWALNDIAKMQTALAGSFTVLAKDALTIAALIALIFWRDWGLALISVVVLPGVFYPMIRLGSRTRRLSRKAQDAVSELSARLQEAVTGQRIVKAFGMEEHEIKRFGDSNDRVFSLMVRESAVRALNSPAAELLGGIGVAVIIWYGGMAVIAGRSSPGAFFSFLAALLMLYEPVRELSHMNAGIQQGMGAAERIFDLLDTAPEIADASGAQELSGVREGVVFEQVSFRYEDELVLREVDLRVRAGETLAIVGSSGAGKTTLVNLIPRFYEVSGGRILIDGIDISRLTLRSLRAQIGLVTQQTFLFNDTVRNNIAYNTGARGKPEVEAAARAAYAYEFITRLPQGFDTVVGEQGVRLSAGQQQRLCIARALLKNAPILILDEATSSLDSESELAVQLALENLMKGRTTFIIAHRLSTVKKADRIVVLSEGRLVEQGSHAELLAAGGDYARLYRLQLAGTDEQAPLPLAWPLGPQPSAASRP